MPTLVLGQNTYATRRQAGTYLDGSARGGPWVAVSSKDKDRALISAFRELEKFSWKGTASAVSQATAAAAVAPGSGFVVGETLTAVGGTGAAVTLKVITVSAGAVATFDITSTGGYSVAPSNPVSFTASGGGSGFTANLTIAAQTASFPRSGLIDKYGGAISSLVVPQPVVDAQVELAFEISQDTALAGGARTDSNIKKVTADTVDVEFFRPVDGLPIPTSAWSLISAFILGGAGGRSGVGQSIQTGTGGESIFTTTLFGRTQGFS